MATNGRAIYWHIPLRFCLGVQELADSLGVDQPVVLDFGALERALFEPAIDRPRCAAQQCRGFSYCQKAVATHWVQRGTRHTVSLCRGSQRHGLGSMSSKVVSCPVVSGARVSKGIPESAAAARGEKMGYVLGVCGQPGVQ